MSRPKASGQCISKGINFSLAYILQSNRDMIGLLLNTHLLYTVQDPFSTVRQSCSKTTFTLFSLFFGGPSLSITDQDWGRDFVDDANTIVDQQLVTHLLCTVQDPFSTVRQSSFQNSFHTLPFVFLVDQVLRKRLYGWRQLHCRSALSHTISCAQFKICLVQLDSPVYQNSFHTLLFVFWWTKS